MLLETYADAEKFTLRARYTSRGCFSCFLAYHNWKCTLINEFERFKISCNSSDALFVLEKECNTKPLVLNMCLVLNDRCQVHQSLRLNLKLASLTAGIFFTLFLL
jgi:hypothetical protein